MQEEIDRAERFGRTQDQLRQMAGFDPEHVEIFGEFEDEFGAQFDFFDDMRQEQAERIKERFEHFREFADEGGGSDEFFRRAEEFRLRIENDPFVGADIRRFAPSIIDEFRQFDIQRNSHGFSEENVRESVAEAARMVERLTQKLNTADVANPGIEASRKLLREATEKLMRAKEALAQNRSGEAFGESNVAIHIAGNGIRHLENATFEKERQEYFDERDKFFEQFRDVAPAERPDIEEFLKTQQIQAPVFDDFRIRTELRREERETEDTRFFEFPVDEQQHSELLCPQLTPPHPSFCENGEIVTKKNASGCIVSFDCREPIEKTGEKSIINIKPTICPLFPFISVDRKECEAKGGKVVEKTLFGCGIIGEECVVEEQRRLDEQRLLDEQNTLEPLRIFDQLR